MRLFFALRAAGDLPNTGTPEKNKARSSLKKVDFPPPKRLTAPMLYAIISIKVFFAPLPILGKEARPQVAESAVRYR